MTQTTSIRWRFLLCSLLIIAGVVASSLSGVLVLNQPALAYTYTDASKTNGTDCTSVGGTWTMDADRNSYCKMQSRPDQDALVFAYAGWLAECAADAKTYPSAEDIQNYKLSDRGNEIIGHIVAQDDGKLDCGKAANIKPKVNYLGYSSMTEFLTTLGCKSMAGSGGTYTCEAVTKTNSNTLFKRIVNAKYTNLRLTDADKYYIALNTFKIGCKAEDSAIEPATIDDENAANSDGSKTYKITDVAPDGTERTLLYKASVGKHSPNISTIPKSVQWQKDGQFECATLANMTTAYAKAYSDWATRNPSAALATKTNSPSANTTGSSKPTCGSIVSGTGWLLCPLLNSAAGLNDLMWALVNSLLFVNPLQQGTPLFEAWGQIRNIANVVFVIFFLIIIYSQLTGAGITNYGIKKLLPRLIICAILVNLSFIVIQVAVDVSNIFGKGLYDLLMSIANKLPTDPDFGWVEVLTAIVAGGASVTGLGLTIGAVGGSGALLWLMAPSMLMAGLAMLAALITLALRQAAIPILAILAPLAFVAYLLPNTERWYKKWRDLLLTMMMLYPIAAVIFAGSQIASFLIWDMGGFWWHIIALVIMAAPLFSLPFIAKQGGAILNAANGMMNKWAEHARQPFTNYARSKAAESAAEYRARDPDENPSRNRVSDYLRRRSRSMAARKRERETNTAAATAEFNNQADRNQVQDWRGNTIDVRRSRVRDIAAKRMGSATDKHLNALTTRAIPEVGNEEYRADNEEQRANSLNTARVMNNTEFDGMRAATERAKTISDTATKLAEIQTEQNAGVLQVHAENEAVAKQHVNAKQHTKRVIAELGTNVDYDTLSDDAKTVADANPGVRNDLRQTIIESTIEASATKGAEDQQKQFVAETLVAAGSGAPGGVAREAAGVAGDAGVARVQAAATAEQAKFRQENVQANKTLFASQGYASGSDATAPDGDLMRVVTYGVLNDGATPATSEQREAAMQMLVDTGSAESMAALFNHVASLPNGDPETLRMQQAFASMAGSSSKKPKSIGGGTLGALNAGTVSGTNFQNLALATLGDGKLSPESLTTIDAKELKLMAAAWDANPAGLDPWQENKLRDTLISAYSDRVNYNKFTDEQKVEIQKLADHMGLILPIPRA